MNKAAVLEFLVWWWGFVFFLVGLQAYFMSTQLWFIHLGLFTGAALVASFKRRLRFGLRLFDRILLGMFALLHFIPLVLQFLGLTVPGLDNVIMAIIGVLIVWGLDIK